MIRECPSACYWLTGVFVLAHASFAEVPRHGGVLNSDPGVTLIATRRELLGVFADFRQIGDGVRDSFSRP